MEGTQGYSQNLKMTVALQALWRGQSFWLHLTGAAADLGLTLLDLSHLSHLIL